jgi:hypothetical protein
MEVERAIDDLYQVWPGEFVTARAALADEARQAKDAAGARTIDKLRRPTLAAWASNRFVRERHAEVEQLLALGESLREAHRTLDRAALRKTSGEQHRLITALAREAAGLAREAGHPLNETVVHEVEQIFHTVLSDPELAAYWATGRLVKAPEAAVGFGPMPPQPPPGHRASPSAAPRGRRRAAEEQQRERVEQARAAERESATEADRRDRALRSAQEAHRAAAAEFKAADRGVERLREELQQAEALREEARAAVAAAEDTVANAQHEARKARRAADAAAHAVARITS